MFAYNPTTQDHSGQIYADLAMQGAQGIASGINGASTSIGDDLNSLNLWKRQVQQAQGIIQAAQPFEDQVDKDGNVTRQGILPAGTTAHLLSLSPSQQVGAAPHLVPLASAAATNNYRQQWNDIRQENADARLNKATPNLITVPSGN